MISSKTILLTLSFALRAYANTLGVDTCSCSPGSYELTFDFSQTCETSTIVQGGGILERACLISPFGIPETSDLTPVYVESIDILEVDNEFTVIYQSQQLGPFNDGDSFKYITDTIDSVSDVPHGIQFNIHAFNQAGEQILNVVNIIFTNDCENYPVISEDTTAGWLRTTDLGPPQTGVCPVSGTSAPTRQPTTFPTLSGQTIGPVATNSPTGTAPSPPEEPTAPTTLAPVTEAPTNENMVPTVMSMDMSMSMSMEGLYGMFDFGGEFGRAIRRQRGSKRASSGSSGIVYTSKKESKSSASSVSSKSSSKKSSGSGSTSLRGLKRSSKRMF